MVYSLFDLNNIENLKIFIKKHPTDSFTEMVINIFLVFHRKRKACLLETTDIQELEIKDEIIMYLKNLAENNGLIFFLEPDRDEIVRYIICYKENLDKYLEMQVEDPDAAIGKLLGFYCSEEIQDFGNMNNDRLEVSIKCEYKKYLYSVVVWVCEKEKTNVQYLKSYVQKMVEKFQEVYTIGKVTYKINEITSLKNRKNNLFYDNIKYVKKHLEDYILDIDNYWIDNGNLTNSFKRDFLEDFPMKNKQEKMEIYKYLWIDAFEQLEDNFIEEGFTGEQINEMMTNFDETIDFDTITLEELIERIDIFMNDS